MHVKQVISYLFQLLLRIDQSLAQGDEQLMVEPKMSYSFLRGLTPTCASTRLTYCDYMSDELYPGELIYVLLKMTPLNFSKILGNDPKQNEDIFNSKALKYCHKIKEDDEYCSSEKYIKFRNSGRHPSSNITVQQETAKSVWLDLISSIHPKADENHSTVKRQTSASVPNVPLCGSITNYVRPVMAMNKHSQWMWIVNLPQVAPEMAQSVKSVACLPSVRNRPCSGCDLPFGYNSVCRQKYVQRRMLALDPSGSDLALDSFWMPSGCSCERVRIR